MKRLVIILSAAFSLATLLLSLTAFAGRYHWLLDLTSHFRLVYFFGALVLLALTLLLRRFHLALLPLAVLIINGWCFLPFYALFEKPTLEEPRLRFKVIQSNVWYLNDQCGTLQEFYRAQNPQLIAAEEIGPATCPKLFSQSEFLARSYPERILNKAMVMLLSRWPVTEHRIHYSAKGSHTLARIHPPDATPFTFIAVHTTRPMDASHDAAQRQHVSELVADINRMRKRGPVIIAGDLNTTPWSVNYRKIIRHTDLQDTQWGQGLQPSWPTWLPVELIPIDHVLVSPEFTVYSRRLGPVVGSDHRPVIVELGL